MLLVGGGTNVLDVTVALALEDPPLLELDEEWQYIEDENEYISGDDRPTEEKELGELLSMNSVLTVVVDRARLLEMAIFEEE